MKYFSLVAFFLLILAAFFALFSCTYTVEPGFRGVEVTLGRVSPGVKPEGFGFKMPFMTKIIPVLVRQVTQGVRAECYSSDLQQVFIDLAILYRVPEKSVISIYKDFYGSPFDTLIAPRVNEAMKEITATSSAEQIVKKREEMKSQALHLARQKIGDLLVIEDLVIQNIELSKELEHAIEQKMVQEQEAAKAKFTQQKAQIESDTAIIKAKGEAESIRIRGEALRQTPKLIDLQIVEKWDGKAPLVIGSGGGGANVLLPLNELEEKGKR